jgi:hypothetical protein
MVLNLDLTRWTWNALSGDRVTAQRSIGDLVLGAGFQKKGDCFDYFVQSTSK